MQIPDYPYCPDCGGMYTTRDRCPDGWTYCSGCAVKWRTKVVRAKWVPFHDRRVYTYICGWMVETRYQYNPEKNQSEYYKAS